MCEADYKVFKGHVVRIPVWINKNERFGREPTQRTRSFLYSALGTVVAHSIQAGGVRFFENGVVSLNFPIANEVLRSRASRTTHPITLHLLQALCATVVERNFAVDNQFDLPQVVARASETLTGDIAARCQIVGGNFFDFVPEDADAYLLKDVIHDWPDDDAARILRNTRRARPVLCSRNLDRERHGQRVAVIRRGFPARALRSSLLSSWIVPKNLLPRAVSKPGAQTQIRRVDFDRVECAKCGEKFEPGAGSRRASKCRRDFPNSSD